MAVGINNIIVHVGVRVHMHSNKEQVLRATSCESKHQVSLKEVSIKLELSRAHTPHVLSICRFLHRDRPAMLTISTSPVVGMLDGRGYDGRQKDAICDISGPCLTIRSTFKPVCC